MNFVSIPVKKAGAAENVWLQSRPDTWWEEAPLAPRSWAQNLLVSPIRGSRTDKH
jgi:hypothetical protein